MGAERYDPFLPGPFAVGVRTLEIQDRDRSLVFPCEIWYPADSLAPEGPPAVDPVDPPAGGAAAERNAPAHPGDLPLVIFSHFSGGGRRTATYLTTHLASHGFAVAAMDHGEVVAPELGPRQGESAADRARRIDAVIAGRVPDVRLLLATLTGPRLIAAGLDGIGLDRELISVVGHSFGGWTALAVPESEPRVRAVVALAPGGSSRPVPGVLLTLAFGWEQVVPLLILTGDRDVPVPLGGVQEIFRRAPEPKRMFVLRRADHEHFADDVEARHEALRAMELPGAAAWMTAAMLPMSQLCPGEHGHTFARGLSLAHLDTVLRGNEAAQRFLADSAVGALAARGVEAVAYCEA